MKSWCESLLCCDITSGFSPQNIKFRGNYWKPLMYNSTWAIKLVFKLVTLYLIPACSSELAPHLSLAGCLLPAPNRGRWQFSPCLWWGSAVRLCGCWGFDGSCTALWTPLLWSGLFRVIPTAAFPSSKFLWHKTALCKFYYLVSPVHAKAVLVMNWLTKSFTPSF